MFLRLNLGNDLLYTRRNYFYSLNNEIPMPNNPEFSLQQYLESPTSSSGQLGQSGINSEECEPSEFDQSNGGDNPLSISGGDKKKKTQGQEEIPARPEPIVEIATASKPKKADNNHKSGK